MSGFVSVAFQPLVPLWLIAALAAIAVPLVLLALYRRAGGAMLRALALAAVLLTLANPSLVEEQRQPLTDFVLVVRDTSDSQSIGERRERTARAIEELRGDLARYPGLEVRVVDGGQAGSGDDIGTALVDAVDRGLADVPRDRVASVVMVTDGQVHDVPAEAGRAHPGGPVHVLLTGRRDERDRRLVIERAPRYGIVGQPQEVMVRVEDQGGEARSAAVTLRLEDGATVVRRLTPGVPAAFPFTVQHAGQTVLELSVEPMAGDELTLRNNRVAVTVNGVRDRLRVLLVSGEPHPGERTWRNLLKSDPSVDLVHFTILRPPEKQDGTPIRELSLISFPTRELFEEKLHEFDLVIFDRYRRRGVLPDQYLRNVAEYVREGGAVLVAAGAAYASPLSLHRTPLADVLPSQPTGETVATGYRPGVTEVGERHPVTAALAAADGATWGRWFHLVEVEQLRGDRLLSGPGDRPLLILDRYGEGRVAQLLSDHAWLWARGYEGGGPHAEILRRLAHWLMQEPDLEEEDLRMAAEGDRLTVTRRTLGAEAPPVTLTGPDGATRTVELEQVGAGRFAATLQVDEPGLWRVSDGERATVAAVGALSSREFSDLRASPLPLAPLVTLTGGGTFWLEDGLPSIRRTRPERDAAGDDWMGLVQQGDYVVTGVRQIPLLPAALVLLLFVGGAMAAWYREGR